MRIALCLITVLVLTLATSVPALAQPRVKLGVDVLREEGFKAIAGKRVGLVCNPASVDGALKPTALVVKEGEGVNLVALYGPEHGVWGDEYAGDAVADKVDARTGVPLYSLYGKTRIPTPEMLSKVDVLIFDMQDIGSRSYTYVTTLKNCITACARDGKTLLVLDRPNPLGGERVEGGPVADEKFRSGVSAIDTPYLHGMTMGELAQMLRDQLAPKWEGLQVVKMQGWTRDMVWQDTGLAWVPTSPHVPHVSSVAAYAATGILGELYVISNGVGYTQPFEVVGKPGLDGEAFAARLNAFWPGRPLDIYFRPIRFKPFYSTFQGEACEGVQVHLNARTAPNLVEVNYRLLELLDAPAVLAAAPKRHSMFDKVTGSDDARLALDKKQDLEPVFTKWRAYSGQFKADRKKWLLY